MRGAAGCGAVGWVNHNRFVLRLLGIADSQHPACSLACPRLPHCNGLHVCHKLTLRTTLVTPPLLRPLRPAHPLSPPVGTVQWIDVDEYLAATPDAIATNAPQRTLAVSGWGGEP